MTCWEKMNPERKSTLLVRIRNGVCYSLLIFAVFCEAYSVLAIDLDQFVPSWYRTLGWFLLVLPAALAAGLLLLWGDRRRLGFYLCATSLSSYAALVLLDSHRGPLQAGDWIFECIWVAFCGLGILAAMSLKNRPSPDQSVLSLFEDA